MKENTKRILTAGAMILIACGAVVGEYFKFPTVLILITTIFSGMLIEYSIRLIKFLKNRKKQNGGITAFGLYFILLSIALISAFNLGNRPWVIFLIFLIIAAADTGAWFFGRMFGGDKMWEKLSAGKTWTGQIMGIVCGTLMAVMYGLLGADTFLPQLLWIGMGVSLLSQYGDLMASFIKRKMGIKDFSNILPGHGGLIDRFDGWVLVLPIIWLVTI